MALVAPARSKSAKKRLAKRSERKRLKGCSSCTVTKYDADGNVISVEKQKVKIPAALHKNKVR